MDDKSINKSVKVLTGHNWLTAGSTGRQRIFWVHKSRGFQESS